VDLLYSNGVLYGSNRCFCGEFASKATLYFALLIPRFAFGSCRQNELSLISVVSVLLLSLLRCSKVL
jgi:hypothetical protein